MKDSSAGRSGLGNRKVQEPERAGDHRPYARVFLALETPHQGEELLEGCRAGQCTSPGVRHEPEALERLEPVEAGEDGVEELLLRSAAGRRRYPRR